MGAALAGAASAPPDVAVSPRSSSRIGHEDSALPVASVISKLMGQVLCYLLLLFSPASCWCCCAPLRTTGAGWSGTKWRWKACLSLPRLFLENGVDSLNQLLAVAPSEMLLRCHSISRLPSLLRQEKVMAGCFDISTSDVTWYGLHHFSDSTGTQYIPLVPVHSKGDIYYFSTLLTYCHVQCAIPIMATLFCMYMLWIRPCQTSQDT